MTLPRWLSDKESSCPCRRCQFDPWVGTIPRRRKWQPTPVFLPGESHGQKSLAGYTLWGRDTTEQVSTTTTMVDKDRDVRAQYLLLSCSVVSNSLRPFGLSMPGLPVLHHLPEPAQTYVYIESVIPSNHLILCRPLLLLPSIFPIIRAFSNESALGIRWPKY